MIPIGIKIGTLLMVVYKDPHNIVPGILWKYSEIVGQCYEVFPKTILTPILRERPKGNFRDHDKLQTQMINKDRGQMVGSEHRFPYGTLSLEKDKGKKQREREIPKIFHRVQTSTALQIGKRIQGHGQKPVWTEHKTSKINPQFIA